MRFSGTGISFRKAAARAALALGALAAPFEASALWVSAEASPPIRFASVTPAANTAMPAVAAMLLDRLRREFYPRRVELVQEREEEVARLAAERQIDFLMCPAGTYVQLTHTQPLSPIGFLTGPEAQQAAAAAATTVVAARTGNPLTLLSLKGARVAVANANSFEGFWAVLREIQKQGSDPDAFFSGVIETGYPATKALDAVSSGRADAAILESCILEQQIREGRVQAGRFQIIGARAGTELACARSTDTYPGWIFAALPDAESAVLKRVAASVLTMPSALSGSEWEVIPSTALDSVRDAMFELKVGPYAYLRHTDLKDLAKRNWQWIALALALLLSAAATSIISTWLVRIRTAELRKALEERERMEAEAEKSRSRIDALERSGVVGQMSSMIAHELRQPLAVITNFSQGLKNRIEAGTADEGTMLRLLGLIASESIKASSIVEHVRSYARKRQPKRIRLDFSALARSAVNTFVTSRRGRVNVVVMDLPQAWIEAEPLEIEMVIFNLLKNAWEAMQASPEDPINVRMDRRGPHWLLSIVDRGPRLSDEDFSRLATPLNSSKPEGLGLGLSIARRIAEAHGGRLNLIRLDEKGLRVELEIPACQEEANDAA